MYERMLVPLAKGKLPEGAFVGVEGVKRVPRSLPVLLGPQFPEGCLTWPLQRFVMHHVQQLRDRGVKASPLVDCGAASDPILDCAHRGDIPLLLMSLEGPYCAVGGCLDPFGHPAAGPRTLPDGYACFGGIILAHQPQVLPLGSVANEGELASSLKDHLEGRRRADPLGRQSSLLSVQGPSVAFPTLGQDRGIFLMTLLGPRYVRSAELGPAFRHTIWGRGTYAPAAT